MKLIAIDTLRAAIGEMDLDDINALLSNALNLVTAPLESFLMTQFQQRVYTDIFTTPPDSPVFDEAWYCCALSAGLVDKTVGVVVRAASTYKGLETAEVTDIEYEVDHVNGIVKFPLGQPAIYVQAVFTAGIVGDDEEYDEDFMPEWLQIATIAYAQAVYRRLVKDRAMEGTKNYAGVSEDVLIHMPIAVQSLAAKYVRWYPTYVKPYHSEFTVV